MCVCAYVCVCFAALQSLNHGCNESANMNVIKPIAILISSLSLPPIQVRRYGGESGGEFEAECSSAQAVAAALAALKVRADAS